MKKSASQLRAGARLVVAREREEDDEAEEQREPGRQHSEDTGRAVAVVEEAVLGRPAANKEERRNRDRGHGGHDQESPDDVHGVTLGLR